MGLYPDLLPGYVALDGPHAYNEEWGTLATTKGLTLQEMKQAVKDGRLSALLVAGPDVPDPDFAKALLDAFDLIAIQLSLYQDTLANEAYLPTAKHWAEVVLPVVSAYEKSGTFTNTCGDLQLLKKAADLAGVK